MLSSAATQLFNFSIWEAIDIVVIIKGLFLQLFERRRQVYTALGINYRSFTTRRIIACNIMRKWKSIWLVRVCMGVSHIQMLLEIHCGNYAFFHLHVILRVKTVWIAIACKIYHPLIFEYFYHQLIVVVTQFSKSCYEKKKNETANFW